MIINRIIFIPVILLLLSTMGTAEYTREESEKLFSLIDWHDYSLDTFATALKEDKHIYLVISAPSWCYWCHVYESKDYLYHESVYHYINKHFIAIFVDSDKRPDLTKKYLESGWPSTTIFSSDFKRITGFVGPRDPLALRGLLEQVVSKKIKGEDSQNEYVKTTPRVPDKLLLENINQNFKVNIEKSFDVHFGGFMYGGKDEWRESQKFPQGLVLRYLAEIGDYEKVNFTLKNQFSLLGSSYHLFDPVEGGFHRYSTNRNWSIPHYEKMIGDQANLLSAYIYLENDLGVVNKTISFLLQKMRNDSGAFYSSQDAYLEDKYFGLDEKERLKIPPPHIDKTIIMDGNAKIINTFLLIYFRTGMYKEVAEKGLEFLNTNMIGDNGAYYYYDNNKAYLTGQSLANAWPLLAFVSGYETLKEEKYLLTANQLADYSLNNLYDWDSGGFFERNSGDCDFYAPNEMVDLSKPYAENGVFAYTMLKMYLITKEVKYLEAGMKTLGYIADIEGLDDSYYKVKAVEIALDNELDKEYQDKEKQIKAVLDEKNFTISKIKNKCKSGFASTGFIFLLLLAFLTGLISFLSPCTFPVLTAFFASGLTSKKGKILKDTLLFFLGLALVFSIYGMGATFIGSLLSDYREIFTKVAGILIILFGVMQILGKGFSGFKIKTKPKPFLLGAVFAIGWSACIGPILASVILMSATSGTMIKGTSLLFVYAMGLSLPLLVISWYFDRLKGGKFLKIIEGKEIQLLKWKGHSNQLIAGFVLIIMGWFMYHDYLYTLSNFAIQSDYVQSFIISTEEMLKKIFLR